MTNYEKLKSLVKSAKILRDAQERYRKEDSDSTYKEKIRQEVIFDEKLQVLYNEINWLKKVKP